MKFWDRVVYDGTQMFMEKLVVINLDSYLF